MFFKLEIMDNVFFEPKDIKKIPKLSGIYKFYNENKELIYIGKAKNLNSRVESYFSNSLKTTKTTSLVSNIKYINFTIVNSEHEAFLLENNLIKEFQPRYNILLKDNKTYPYIVITNEEYPRIISTEILNEKYKYIFGPFSNRSFMHDIINIITKLFKVRTCKYNINEEDILNNKFQLCLEYHIENCCGVCKNLVSKQEYLSLIDKVVDILKGNLQKIKSEIKNKMNEYSKKEQYKLAQKYKTKLQLLSSYESNSIISNPKLKNIDIIVTETSDNKTFCSYMIIKSGMIIFTKNDVFYNLIAEDIYSLYRGEYKSNSSEIISNTKFKYNNIISKTPKIGDKKKLIELCEKNIQTLKHEIKIKSTLEVDKNIVLQSLKDLLFLKKIPFHIECFDNSNLQGTNPVSSCVVFKNGEPSKEDYRKFNVKTVIGADDFKTMEEVIERRYFKNENLPDLIVIDGGKGQLNSAVKILKKLDIFKKVDIIGLAKEFEEIYKYRAKSPIILKKDSEELHLLQHVRDEAHRFAITFHRKKRSEYLIKK